MNREKSPFAKAAAPLMKYLVENHHPMIQAIVNSYSAELLEGIEGTGTGLDYERE
jgi:hypothetical protein